MRSNLNLYRERSDSAFFPRWNASWFPRRRPSCLCMYVYTPPPPPPFHTHTGRDEPDLQGCCLGLVVIWIYKATCTYTHTHTHTHTHTRRRLFGSCLYMYIQTHMYPHTNHTHTHIQFMTSPISMEEAVSSSIYIHIHRSYVYTRPHKLFLSLTHTPILSHTTVRDEPDLHEGGRSEFAKVSSQLNLIRKTAVELTFEKIYQCCVWSILTTISTSTETLPPARSLVCDTPCCSVSLHVSCVDLSSVINTHNVIC